MGFKLKKWAQNLITKTELQKLQKLQKLNYKNWIITFDLNSKMITSKVLPWNVDASGELHVSDEWVFAQMVITKMTRAIVRTHRGFDVVAPKTIMTLNVGQIWFGKRRQILRTDVAIIVIAGAGEIQSTSFYVFAIIHRITITDFRRCFHYVPKNSQIAEHRKIGRKNFQTQSAMTFQTVASFGQKAIIAFAMTGSFQTSDLAANGF